MYTNYTTATIVSKAYLLCLLIVFISLFIEKICKVTQSTAQCWTAHSSTYVHNARTNRKKHSMQIHWIFCGKYIHKYSLYREVKNIVYLQAAANKLKLWAANSLTWEAVGALKSNWDSCFVFALFLFKLITERKGKKDQIYESEDNGKYWMDVTGQPF